MISKKKNEVKIIDLGFAKILGRDYKIREKVGTLLYMAPEVYQFKEYNNKYDKQLSDLKSITFGLVLPTNTTSM